MSGQQGPSDNSRKRHCTERHLLRAKRQKPSCLSIEGNASLFWDQLTKIHLTKDALRELDRRNREFVAQRTPQRVQPIKRPINRPVTRKFLADSQKERRRTQAANELLHNSGPETRKAVKVFARRGGPDLSDLRSYPEPVSFHSAEPAMSSSGRSRHLSRGSSSGGRSKHTTTNTTATRSSGPKDANYQQKLIDGHVYAPGYRFPDGSKPPLPNGWDELNQRLARPRPSLSPSIFPEERYCHFVDEDETAYNEDAVKDAVLPAMLTAMGASNSAQRNVLFNNLDPLVPGISQAKPDYYYGAPPEQIHQEVRGDLSSHIVPSTSTHLPAVPNFSIEAKGPLGTNREALLQACNVGAIGARAMHSLENYGQDTPEYHGRVTSISSVYNSGQLKFYGHSIAQPNGPKAHPHYYMHQLDGYTMTGNKDAFLRGATVYKNARDWTEESRNAAIANANATAAAAWVEEDEVDDEADGEAAEEAQAEAEEGEEEESTQTLQSFAYSTFVEERESLTSQEDEYSYTRPPAKRPSGTSYGSKRRKRDRFQ